MDILGVLDLQGSVVVRGVAGRRAEYRPIVSRLTASTAPREVAGALRRRYGLEDLYLADLDAIAGGDPALAVYQALRTDGFRLWVDPGIRTAPQALRLAEAVTGVVVGLETLAGSAALAEIVAGLGQQVVFSLDLSDGLPRTVAPEWQGLSAAAIASQALDLGVRRLLVLDLARVGVAGGPGTETLCSRLAAANPDRQIWAGGGVRDLADLRRLAACGVQAVLLASALHDERISPDDLRALRGGHDTDCPFS
jgi:phosphoribosylformimino-5-aminoimidazole carboxamide ribotide isomerase